MKTNIKPQLLVLDMSENVHRCYTDEDRAIRAALGLAASEMTDRTRIEAANGVGEYGIHTGEVVRELFTACLRMNGSSRLVNAYTVVMVTKPVYATPDELEEAYLENMRRSGEF